MLSSVALRFLGDGRQLFSEQFNKTGHGLVRSVLVDTLERLQHAGLVFFQVLDDSPDVPGVPLSRAEIALALDEDDRTNWTCYALTSRGGEQWEAFARPDWSRFIDVELSPKEDEISDGPDKATFTSADLKRLKKVVEFHSLCDQPIDIESVKYTEIGLWNPTYWKTLPCGHIASVQFCGGQIRSGFDKRPWLAFGGYCRFRDSWYDWK